MPFITPIRFSIFLSIINLYLPQSLWNRAMSFDLIKIIILVLTISFLVKNYLISFLQFGFLPRAEPDIQDGQYSLLFNSHFILC